MVGWTNVGRTNVDRTNVGRTKLAAPVFLIAKTFTLDSNSSDAFYSHTGLTNLINPFFNRFQQQRFSIEGFTLRRQRDDIHGQQSRILGPRHCTAKSRTDITNQLSKKHKANFGTISRITFIQRAPLNVIMDSVIKTII
jgi:hypothetical protein